MTFVIASMTFCSVIKEHVYKGYVHIKPGIIWPEYLLPTTMAIIKSPSPKPVAELW